MKAATKAAMAGVLGGLIIAQAVSVRRDNPSPNGVLSAPPDIELLLSGACNDCHSNATRWPWYGRIAPVSWLIAQHVAAGRKQLNFSEWDTYYPATRRRKLQWIARVVREQKMPPWSYRLMHPAARLTGALPGAAGTMGASRILNRIL
jgi:hypothetical protein